MCGAKRKPRTHGLKDAEVFRHYMKRLSQRGWGQFTVESLEPATGRSRISVTNSAFVLAHKGAPRRTCYMFRGWFAGALEFVGTVLGQRVELTSEEIQCAAEGARDLCVFETAPKPDRACLIRRGQAWPRIPRERLAPWPGTLRLSHRNAPWRLQHSLSRASPSINERAIEKQLA